MKNNKLQEALDNLRDVLRQELPETTTSVKIFVNCEGLNVTINCRTGQELRESGISMRNIQGEFIK